MIRSFSVNAAALAALALIVATGLFATAFLKGRPQQLFPFEEAAPAKLPLDGDIAGWASFDKDSYSVGEKAICRIRILYKKGIVEPDFDAFLNYISFLPFDQRDVNERLKGIGNDVMEYVAEYELQVTDVKPLAAYEFDPAVIFYTRVSGSSDNLYSLQVERPRVHIASFYPGGAGDIHLLGLKGGILDPIRLRQGLMGLSGAVLIALAACVLWRSGRRRRRSELSDSERLWREFHELPRDTLDNRTFLLNCERIFVRLLQGHAQMSPESFWSGGEPEDKRWSEIVTRARDVLRRIYRQPIPGDTDVNEIASILRERLSSIVQEERLQREQEPSFVTRLLQQPRVLVLSGTISGVAVSILFLAGHPLIWLSSDVAEYNKLATRIQNGTVIEDNLYMRLSTLGEAAGIDNIKAAAFYNAGTLRAGRSFAQQLPSRQELILGAVFQEGSPDALLHTLLDGPFNTEEEIVTTLTAGAVRLREAKLDLQAAVRIQPGDEATRRNLELVIKWQDALMRRLTQLRDFYEEKGGEQEQGTSGQGLIKIIEAALAQEYDGETRRTDSRGYVIYERF